MPPQSRGQQQQKNALLLCLENTHEAEEACRTPDATETTAFRKARHGSHVLFILPSPLPQDPNPLRWRRRINPRTLRYCAVLYVYTGLGDAPFILSRGHFAARVTHTAHAIGRKHARWRLFQARTLSSFEPAGERWGGGDKRGETEGGHVKLN